MLVKRQGGYLTAIGVPTFSASVPIENGFINVANGNLHLEIPLGGSFPQRGGGSVRTALLYDSAFWMCCGGSGSWATGVGQAPGWGIVSSGAMGIPSYTTTYQRCWDYDPALVMEDDFKNFGWTAPDGTLHLFPISVSLGGWTDPNYPDCLVGRNNPTGDAFATDNSGYHMYVTAAGDGVDTIDVYSPDGTHVYTMTNSSNVPTDPNGNYYTKDTPGNTIDTLGRTPVSTTWQGNVLSLSGVSGNTLDYYVLDSQGYTQHYAVVMRSVDVNTSFNVEGVRLTVEG